MTVSQGTHLEYLGQYRFAPYIKTPLEGFLYIGSREGCCILVGMVIHSSSLKVLFMLIWVLALAHGAAEYYHLYWMYRWLDVPMHFLGGMWVGLAVMWFCFRSGYVWNQHTPPFSIFTAALVGGLLIGFIWELYEYVVWQFSGKLLPDNYLGDSLLDLVMDVVGALTAYGGVVLLRKGSIPE